MGVVFLKLPADDLITSCFCADSLHLSTAAYIHSAMARQRATQLKDASKKVRKESLRVSREFDAIELTPLTQRS